MIRKSIGLVFVSALLSSLTALAAVIDLAPGEIQQIGGDTVRCGVSDPVNPNLVVQAYCECRLTTSGQMVNTWQLHHVSVYASGRTDDELLSPGGYMSSNDCESIKSAYTVCR